MSREQEGYFYGSFSVGNATFAYTLDWGGAGRLDKVRWGGVGGAERPRVLSPSCVIAPGYVWYCVVNSGPGISGSVESFVVLHGR